MENISREVYKWLLLKQFPTQTHPKFLAVAQQVDPQSQDDLYRALEDAAGRILLEYYGI